MAEYRELVQSTELKDLDIGILALNAGTFSLGPIDKLEDKWFEPVWNCTGLQVIYLSKALASTMLARDKRCALLITSSVAARAIFPCNASYSATKCMVSKWGECLHYEMKSNVDVTVWEPGFVESNIHLEKPPAGLTVKTDKAVSDILRYLGKTRKTEASLTFLLSPFKCIKPAWIGT